MKRRPPTESVIKRARKEGRKVLWTDNTGEWRAAKNINSTPHWATEILELEPATTAELELHEQYKNPTSNWEPTAHKESK